MGAVRGADAELIRGCKRGEARAWDRLIRKYERLVFSIPRSYGLPPADAADVSQLTCTILIQSLDSLTEESNVKAWLATVARRHTWRLMERGRREGPGREDDLADTPWLLGGEKPSERWETIDWLDGASRKLLTTFGVLALLGLVIVGVTVWAIFQWQSTDKFLEEHYERSLLLENIRATTFRASMEIPERGRRRRRRRRAVPHRPRLRARRLRRR